MKNQLNETEVVKSLNKKNDIRITPKSKKLIILSSDSRAKRNDLGGGSWGKIDFLKRKHGYKTLMVDKFINFNDKNRRKS